MEGVAIRRLLEWLKWRIIHLSDDKNGKKWIKTLPRKTKQYKQYMASQESESLRRWPLRSSGAIHVSEGDEDWRQSLAQAHTVGSDCTVQGNSRLGSSNSQTKPQPPGPKPYTFISYSQKVLCRLGDSWGSTIPNDDSGIQSAPVLWVLPTQLLPFRMIVWRICITLLTAKWPD